MIMRSVLALVWFVLAIPLYADLLTGNTTDSLTDASIPTATNNLYAYVWADNSGFNTTDEYGIIYNVGSPTSQPLAWREYTCAPGYKIIGVKVIAILSGGSTSYAQTGVGGHQEVFQVVSDSTSYAWTSVDANIFSSSGYTGMKYYFCIPAADNVGRVQVQFSADTNWQPRLHQIDLIVVPVESGVAFVPNLLTENTTDSLTTPTLVTATNNLYAYVWAANSGFTTTDSYGIIYNAGSTASQPLAYREYTCASGYQFRGVDVIAIVSGDDTAAFAATGTGSHQEVFQVVAGGKTYSWDNVQANDSVSGYTGMKYHFSIPREDEVGTLQVQFSADTDWQPRLHQIDLAIEKERSVKYPTFSPAGPEIVGITPITISSDTPGAVIYFTTTGNPPTTGYPPQTNPMTTVVSDGTVLRAIAVVGGVISYETIQTYVYPKAGTPTFSSGDMMVTMPTEITISSTTTGADIYYTLDGTIPTSSSLHYTRPVTISKETTVKAIALASGYKPSDINVITYIPRTIPILAWSGIAESLSTLENFQELRAAGFTHQLQAYSSFSSVEAILGFGKETGIKTVTAMPTTYYGDLADFVAQVKDDVAFGGYFVIDEPGQYAFATVGATVAAIQAIDSDILCYINLLPTGGSDSWGTPTYLEYVDSFLNTVPVTMLSFDHYPITYGGITSDFYENLEIISAKAKDAGIPMWAFALSTAIDGGYPVATLPGLRFQVFSDLAYGAQCIQYFTYSAQPCYPEFHDSPVDENGNPTNTYYLVQSMNEEIKGLSPVFLGAQVKSVGHTGSLPTGTTAYVNKAPITSLTTSGSDGAVVSRLINGHTWYLAVVNRDIDSTMTLQVQVDTSRGICTVSKEGIETTVGSGTVSYTVNPGDIVVFKWSALAGDANLDDAVDVSDLGILAANYGSMGKTWAQGDFNADGIVDVSDLGILAANYGTGTGSSLDFNADAKALGLAAGYETTAVKDQTPVISTLGCGSAGLPLVAGLFLMGLFLARLKE